MNIARILFDTVFYSNSNLSLALKKINTHDNTFVIKYKHSVCGSLYISDKQIALSYGRRGLHLFKGLIDFENMQISYDSLILELYTKLPNRRILRAKCDQETYLLIIGMIKYKKKNYASK